MLTWWRQNGSTGSGHAARLVCVIWSECGSPSGLCVTWERARIVPEDLPLCEGRAGLWADGTNKVIHCCQELTAYCVLRTASNTLLSGTDCVLPVIHFCQELTAYCILRTASNTLLSGTDCVLRTAYCQLAALHCNWHSGTPRLDCDLSRTVSATAPTVWTCFSSWKYSGYFNIQQFYVRPTQCIYVFCVDLRTNSDYFPTQQ